MDRSPTPPEKTPEEELFCQEIQRRLLEAEFKATDITGMPLIPGTCKFLRGPRIISGR